ncbi:hypothetical protein [Segniliparus rugosus]|uniref:hypothetical protein n=1 Tax=Segniliparus rugosus TaxID=286804 RepID=UPI00146FBBC8|nr:hypothetical protein [Segniliparus rugosus]
MCHPATCRVCGKTTWSGCGAHIESVKRRVPPERWCDGHQQSSTPSWLGRLFRRSN